MTPEETVRHSIAAMIGSFKALGADPICIEIGGNDAIPRATILFGTEEHADVIAELAKTIIPQGEEHEARLTC
jgi:hypothetical protein